MPQHKVDISPQIIAKTSVSRLSEIIRKSEIMIAVQIESLRAIDNRATQIMTSAGVLLSILFGFLGITNERDNAEHSIFFLLCVALFVFLGIASVFSCLKIIQSDKINPPGNNALLLLQDISNGYSERGEKIDYMYNLSESQIRNERLIDRNAKLLKLASWCFFLMLLSIIVAGYQLL